MSGLNQRRRARVKQIAAAAFVGVALSAAVPASAGADDAQGDPGGDIAVSVTIPAGRDSDGDQDPDGDRTVLINASLTWGFNLETRGKSYFGECNFLMAGRPGTLGDAGTARGWGPGAWGKNLYHAESGNTKVVNGKGDTVGFEQRCLDPQGQPVVYNAARQSDSTYTDTQVRLTGGAGWRDDQSGQARIAWEGTFSVIYYDGLTYFWIENPVLTVRADGGAELTATAGGYGSPREGGAWGRHPDSAVVLAKAPSASGNDAREGVLTSPNGLTLKPVYANQAITVPAGASAQRLGADSSAPGAWPQSFVDFQGQTGLHSYWYSSGAAIDHRKPPDPVYISWDAARPLDSPIAPSSPATNGSGSGWNGGQLLKQAVAGAASRRTTNQGGADATTVAADPWDLQSEPVVVTKAPKDLVPE
ncbi:MAG: hypothetical protein LBS27_09625, partial [Bifidobacteriaceae bacterium]|nr:hypothetical protein [Bifidobacteriaceae bacterium]